MQIEIYGDTLCALVTAACLAATGNKIRLKLPPGKVVQSLQNGTCPYVEPDLAAQLQRQQDNLQLVDFASPLLPHSQAVFLAVGPQQYDLVDQVVAQVRAVDNQLLLVNQTAFPVGTSEQIARQVAPHAVVYLPDMLQEGAAIRSFTAPNWFIIGCNNAKGLNKIKEILHPFARARNNLMFMPLRDAEFAKLAISGMLATRVTFMNELANVAETIGVDIENVRRGVGSDPRIGAAYLYPGCGFGGLSFSRDVNVLTQTVAGIKAESNFFEQILRSNELQKEVLFRKLWQYYKADIKGKTIAIWGAAFKPNTDRIDNAPALNLIDALLAQQVNIKVHDPQALANLRRHYSAQLPIEYCQDQYTAAVNADALLLVTEWRNYWSPDFKLLRQNMNYPLIIDGRNIYDKQQIHDYGFDYLSIGR